MEDLTLLGHVAFVRRYVVELRALASAAPNIAPKLRQIAYSLNADADQIEKVAAGEAMSGKGSGARPFIATFLPRQCRVSCRRARRVFPARAYSARSIRRLALSRKRRGRLPPWISSPIASTASRRRSSSMRSDFLSGSH